MIFKENLPVITGVGVASSIGNRKATFLNSLENGKSGLSFIDRFDLKSLPVKKAFLIKEKLDIESDKDPYVNFALHATKEALDDSHIGDLSKEDVAVISSSSKGGVNTFFDLQQGEKELADSFYNIHLDRSNQAIQHQFNLQGPTIATTAACATGLHSIIRGVNSLQYGESKVALAGASDASITPLMLAGYNQMQVYSHDDMRPFDKKRSGFIIGEGAGMLVLESQNHAKERGARVYAKIRGYLLAQDRGVFHHDPEEHTLSQAITRLLEEAKLSPSDIDYINLHGTSTILGDEYEANEIKRAFGKHLNKIHTNAVKSMFGHMLGAAGAVESIVTALSCYHQTIYPTINSSQLAPFADFNLNINRRTEREIRYALKISMGFGGHVTLLLVES